MITLVAFPGTHNVWVPVLLKLLKGGSAKICFLYLSFLYLGSRATDLQFLSSSTPLIHPILWGVATKFLNIRRYELQTRPHLVSGIHIFLPLYMLIFIFLVYVVMFVTFN